jgi:hypothetical protein
MPRQQGETDQQAEQVHEQHPFVRHVGAEAGQADAELEAGEQDLVAGDDGEAGERDLQHVVVEQRHAEQGGREEDEIERDAAYGETLGSGGGERQGSGQRCAHTHPQARGARMKQRFHPLLHERLFREILASTMYVKALMPAARGHEIRLNCAHPMFRKSP